MKKLLSIAICLLMLLVSTNFAQKRAVKQTKSKISVSKKAKSIKSNTYVCELGASVVALNLSQTEIASDCSASDENCSTNKIIKVTVTAVDTGDNRYVYAVSAGKVMGEGYDVEWDLSGVPAGGYTITAGISQPAFDGKGRAVYGMTKTKTVVIKN
jgi:hypothetical protein